MDLLALAKQGKYQEINSIIKEHIAKQNSAFLVSLNLNQRDENQDSLLSLAIKARKLSLAKTLIGLGVNVNLIDLRGSSILHKVIDLGDVKLLKTICKKSANLNYIDRNGATLLHYSASYGEACLKEKIGTAAYKEEIIKHKRQLSQREKIIDFLLEKGLSINAIDAKGQTALHCAASHRGASLCKKLIDKGAERFLKDKNGNSEYSLYLQKLINEFENVGRKPETSFEQAKSYPIRVRSFTI